jgi:hypothetical protein
MRKSVWTNFPSRNKIKNAIILLYHFNLYNAPSSVEISIYIEGSTHYLSIELYSIGFEQGGQKISEALLIT